MKSFDMDQVDLRGHFHGVDPEILKSDVRRSLREFCVLQEIKALPPRKEGMDLPELTAMEKTLEEIASSFEEDDEQMLRFGVEVGFHGCSSCGEDVRIKQEGTQWIATSACPYPKGIPAYSVEIDLISGRLGFANDMRNLFPLLDDFNINLLSESKRCTEAYGQQGCIHVYVGNTCPSVNRVDRRTVVVGRNGADETWNEETDECEPIENPETLPGERVGSVCTDLWWVSMADVAQLEERVKELGEDLPSDLEVVHLEPGRYRVTVYKHLLKDTDGAEVYFDVKRVGEVSSTEFPSRPRATHISLEEEIKLSRLAYPSLYPSRARVLNHFFCVIGNGMEWYDGVLVIGGSRREAAKKRLAAGEEVTWKTTEPPKSFYPLCEYSRLACVPDDVKPDWLDGVYEVLDMILATDPSIDDHGHKNSTNIAFAMKVKEDLDRRFKRGRYAG